MKLGGRRVHLVEVKADEGGGTDVPRRSQTETERLFPRNHSISCLQQMLLTAEGERHKWSSASSY